LNQNPGGPNINCNKKNLENHVQNQKLKRNSFFTLGLEDLGGTKFVENSRLFS